MRYLEQRSNSPDEGWDEKEALRHWGQICGPSPISPYLHSFLLDEFKLHPASETKTWQRRLVGLFSYMLRQGMPMEELHIRSFRESVLRAPECRGSYLGSTQRFRNDHPGTQSDPVLRSHYVWGMVQAG